MQSSEVQFSVRRVGVYRHDETEPMAMFECENEAERWIAWRFGKSSLEHGAFHLRRVDLYGTAWLSDALDPKVAGFRRFFPLALRRLRKWMLCARKWMCEVEDSARSMQDMGHNAGALVRQLDKLTKRRSKLGH
jgi:hypothetical protein